MAPLGRKTKGGKIEGRREVAALGKKRGKGECVRQRLLKERLGTTPQQKQLNVVAAADGSAQDARAHWEAAGTWLSRVLKIVWPAATGAYGLEA